MEYIFKSFLTCLVPNQTMWVQRYKQRPPEIFFLNSCGQYGRSIIFLLKYPLRKQGPTEILFHFFFPISSVNIAGQLYFFLKHLLWKLFFQQQWHLTTFCATQTPFQVNFSKDISFHFFQFHFVISHKLFKGDSFYSENQQGEEDVIHWFTFS